MLRFLLIIFLLLGAVGLGLPPQVKHVFYYFDRTVIYFWYPTLINEGDGFKFQERVVLMDSQPGAIALQDKLRGTRYLCGTSYCGDMENKVRAAWLENKNAIQTMEAAIAAVRETLANKERESQALSQFLVQNNCSTIADGPARPAFACAPSEAEEVGLSMCIIREAGPRLCELAIKDNVPENVPKFIKDLAVRESCAAFVSTIMGEEYSILEKTTKRYTEEILITAGSWLAEWIFGKDGKNVYDTIVIGAKTKRCLPYGIEKCTATYNDWQFARTAYFEGHSAEIQACQTSASQLTVVQDEILGLKGKISLAVAQLGELNSLRQTLEEKVEMADFQNVMQVILR